MINNFLDMVLRFLITCLLKFRWLYFHLHPSYILFTMEKDKYFQHKQTGQIHYNYSFKK